MAEESVLPAGSPVPDEIVRSIQIHARAETVFGVVSEPGWFINDGEYREHKIIRQGSIVRVIDPVHGSFQISIEKREPPNRLMFRWLGGGLGEISDAPNNTVDFIIDPAGSPHVDLVQLTVKERGFARIDVDEALRRRNYEENYRGWVEQLELARGLAEKKNGEKKKPAKEDGETKDAEAENTGTGE